jgi:hypothetical protein
MINGTFPVFDSANVSTVLNVTYQNGQLGATPMPMFLVLMGTAFVLLILAFREPLRNEGNINVAKVGLSLCGALMGIVGALSSVSIVENMGSTVSTYELYTVDISSYVIWNSPYITGALIISSVLCAIMFIYTLIQPAVLVTPEKDDYKSNAAGERK